MEKQILELMDRFDEGNMSINDLEQELLTLYNVSLSLFQKNRLDLLNWAKSELEQETNTKLGRTMTPYRSEKIIFLRRIIDWLNNEA